IRTGHGLGQRASDFLTVALCVDCHRGTHGFHGTKALMKIAKLSEMDLLAETIRKMDEKRGGKDIPPSSGDETNQLTANRRKKKLSKSTYHDESDHSTELSAPKE
ncbi:MAG: hypothetical protein ACO3I1_04095, partial [Burkholderiales bacterium]